MEITESIIDPIQSVRCKNLFNGELGKEILKKDAKSQILDTIYKWLDKQGFKFEDYITDVYIEGSSVGFQYTDTSDIDVSVYSKIPDETINKLWTQLPNGNNLKETKMPINYYLMKKGSKDLDTTDNCYDVKNDKWIKQQKIDDAKNIIPFTYLSEIAKFFTAGVDDRINEYESDNVELSYIKKLSKEEISIDEKNKLISQKETEIKSDLDAIYIAHCMLKALRRQAYGVKGKEKGWYPDLLIKIESTEYNDPNHSVSNAVYKMIEKLGYFEKLEKYEELRNKLFV
jgi:hypothetical protein